MLQKTKRLQNSFISNEGHDKVPTFVFRVLFASINNEPEIA